MNKQVIRILDASKILLPAPHAKEPGFILSLSEKGMLVSTLQEEALLVRMMFLEEGFLSAGRLARLGWREGSCFDNP